MLTGILIILLEFLVLEVAALACLDIYEADGCIRMVAIFQRTPIYISLMAGNVDAIDRMTCRHAHFVVFVVEAGAETIEIRTEKDIVRTYDKNERD